MKVAQDHVTHFRDCTWIFVSDDPPEWGTPQEPTELVERASVECPV
jgi:hypothetical protein